MNQNTKPPTTRNRSNPARWQRLKSILADVSEYTSPEDRTAALKQFCAGDTALLHEAQTLLAQDTTVFEELAEMAATRLRCDEHDRIGERMGAYAIVKEIGRGGMGAVYLAERADGQFQKRVAIKVLKRGTDTDEVLRRFRIERQILANLEHQNITRLLDAGTTADGLPYFVMEFIEGTPITKFVQRKNTDRRGRITLFLKVCSAVDLAHRHQIIHRDIKPSNVLVNEDGEPKLLDFGIAKLLSSDSDDGITTVAADRRLTPNYAAPEQKEGQAATVATDVYSLGALLYELLTEHSPCISSNGNGSKREVSAEPQLRNQPASDLHSKVQLSGRLEQIVARAMRSDPAQRYRSVGVLSEDVERYLNGAAPRSEDFSTCPTVATSTRSKLTGRPNPRHHWHITAAVLSAIMFGAILFFSTRTKLPWVNTVTTVTTPAGANSAPLAAVHSIAVLPFAPLGQDMGDELLGLGMADAVIGRMSNLKHVAILPTSAVAKYNGPANDPFAAGRTLGVDAILSGTIQRSGDRIRATVQLVHLTSGQTIWSEKFDQTFTDIFGVQDAISDNVARSLALNLTSDEQKQLAKRYTTNASAYDEYLMGLHFWNTRAKDGLEKAIDHFGRATEKDPNFALAYALMSDCYYLQFNYGYRSERRWVQDAKAAVERALLLDDSIAEAHVASAMIEFYQEEDEIAIASLQRALSLNPNLAVAHLRYGWALLPSGHLDEAVREIKRAQELDPLSAINNSALGLILGLARQFRGCLDYCYKAAELAPDEVMFQENLAYAYLLNGMYQEAIEHYQKVAVLNPDKRGDVLASVATALNSMGRKSEAESMMPEILQLGSAGKANPFYIAALYCARGDKNAAFEWFDKGLRKASEVPVRAFAKEQESRLIREPLLDPLRSDSRFAALLRQYSRGSVLETTAKR